MSRDNFHEKLAHLETHVHEMGNILHQLMSTLITSLQTRQLERELVDSCLKTESRLDELEYLIEKGSLELLALQQPMAIDLRLILCVIKISMDLERIGDHLRKIFRKTRKLIESGYPEPFTPLVEMSILLRQMVDQILIAFNERNLDLVSRTLQLDDQINHLQRTLFQEYIRDMQAKPSDEMISAGIYLLFITRFLERIGDHVENIGERVAYLITGDMKKLKSARL